MDITLEILTFLGGCLFFAFRGWLGKQMLAALGALLKRLFKVSQAEMLAYEKQRLAHVTAKQSAKPRVR